MSMMFAKHCDFCWENPCACFDSEKLARAQQKAVPHREMTAADWEISIELDWPAMKAFSEALAKASAESADQIAVRLLSDAFHRVYPDT